MTTAELTRRATIAEQHILLKGVSWEFYEAALKEFDTRLIRLTYDQGSLEIMTLSHGHENYAKLLGRLIEALTEELNIPIHSGGSTTFKQEAKKRGLEPDECYWIQNEPRMRGRKNFDIDADPPPDLALEVDITSSSLNRLAIYATLGVGEVWRYDGETLSLSRLRAGEYERVDRSPTSPELPPAEVLRFLRESDTLDETTLVRTFRAWVREHLLPTREPARTRAPRQTKRPKK